MAPTNWLFAFIPVMLAYSGWNAAAYVAEEIRDPGRNVPRALAIGTIAVIAIYFGLNVLYLYVFSVGELAQLKGNVLDVVAERLLGAGAGNIMGIVSIISLMASNSAMTFAGPRVYYAMARDGVFFPAAAKVHPAYKTPAIAIVAQAIWTSLLILLGQRRCAAHLHGLLDHAVCRHRGDGVVRAAPARAERRAPVQGAGLSGRAGDLRDRELRDSCQRALHRSRQTGDRRHTGGPVSLGLPRDRDGIAAVLVFQEPTHVGANNEDDTECRRDSWAGPGDRRAGRVRAGAAPAEASGRGTAAAAADRASRCTCRGSTTR